MPAPNLLERLGLHRPELRAWALYDWANSAFMVTVVTAVFPIYFSSVAAADLPPAEATALFGLTTTVALTFVALLAPVLGALADFGLAGIEGVFGEMVAERGIGLGKAAQPVRVALTGSTVSPGIYEVIHVLGRDRTLARLAGGIRYIDSGPEGLRGP